jgi:hypothetical protein
VRRLLWHLVWARPPDPQTARAWSRWRRRHQQRARKSHWKRRTKQTACEWAMEWIVCLG